MRSPCGALPLHPRMFGSGRGHGVLHRSWRKSTASCYGLPSPCRVITPAVLNERLVSLWALVIRQSTKWLTQDNLGGRPCWLPATGSLNARTAHAGAVAREFANSKRSLDRYRIDRPILRGTNRSSFQSRRKVVRERLRTSLAWTSVYSNCVCAVIGQSPESIRLDVPQDFI